MISNSHNEKSNLAPLLITNLDNPETISLLNQYIPLFHQTNFYNEENIEDPIVDFTLKVIKGIYKGKFLYINLTSEGETFGSDPNVDLTMYIENAGLSPIHAEIKYNDKRYLLKDLDSQSGTWIQLRQDNPMEIYEDMEIRVGSDLLIFNYGNEIEDQFGIWLDRIGIKIIKPLLNKEKYKKIQDLAKLSKEEIESFGLKEEELNRLRDAINNINTDFVNDFQTKKIKITNAQTKKGMEITWSGAMIRTKDDFQVVENSPAFSRDENDSEFIIKYQYGRYWIVLPDSYSEHHIYFRLAKGATYILVPDDVIVMGDLYFLVQRFNTGAYENKGTRGDMEDMSVIRHDLWISDKVNVSFYAIFDGHGGTACCRFLVDNLITNFRNYLLKDEIPFDEQPHFYKFIYNTIIKTVEETDIQYYRNNKEVALGTGSAAIIVLIIGDLIICANVGDSRAVLSRAGEAINLSKDHKPDNYEELKRIEQSGGFVHGTRVMARLGVSRSFGDFEYKTISQSDIIKNLRKGNDGKDLVIVMPEIREIKIDYLQDEFIVIGCDGLFDVFSSQECVNFVREKLSEMNFMEQDPTKVAKELVDKAVSLSIKRSRNSDNVSIIIICLTRGVVQSLDKTIIR